MTRGRPRIVKETVMEPEVNTRPDPRPALREDDSRTLAAKRAAEIRAHLGDAVDEVDRFGIDPSTIPDGYEYEWKRFTVFNKEDPAYQTQLARAGWEMVPTSRHPSFMPANTKQKFIERDGMVLMQIPKVIADEYREKPGREARESINQNARKIAQTEEGQLERRAAKIKRAYEPTPIPD